MIYSTFQRAAGWLRLLALTGMMAFGIGVMAAHGPNALAQDPGDPGFCHNKPEMCTQWDGADCGDDCNPNSGPVCCQPDPD